MSIDAVETSTFQAMADTDQVNPQAIFDGVDEALRVGLTVKVNAVVRRASTKTKFCRWLTSAMTVAFLSGSSNTWTWETPMLGNWTKWSLVRTFDACSRLNLARLSPSRQRTQ